MENQHRLIKGYRELSTEEIAGMNALKEIEKQALAILEANVANGADGRWSAIGKTHLQQGFMAAIRAIAKPQE